MCRKATCETCSKPTFAGCGMHIEAVLGDVPKAQRCSCRETASQGENQNGAQKKRGAWPFL